MAITTALEMYRGEDRTFHFVMTPAVDITGWEMTLTVAKEKNRATKILSVACVIDSAPDGTFHATIPAALTSDVAPGNYYWDVWRVNSGSNRIAGIGRFTLIASVREPEE